MKTSILIAAIAACALSTPFASAQDMAPPDRPAMGMDMGQQMSQMQQNMTVMQAQMTKIRATTDPTERRKLMQAHMQAMQENMTAMSGMGGPMKMGDSKPMAGGDMMQRHQMMENRMSMMQMMMEQMLQHQQAMESMPAK
jgi:hypothetical protein